MNGLGDLENRFDTLTKALFPELVSGEELSLGFMGEASTFMRFNGAKVRQIGEVDLAYAVLRLFRDGRSLEVSFNLSGEAGADRDLAARILSRAREELGLLPPDPYRLPPKAAGKSREIHPGSLPASSQVVAEVLGPAKGLDFVGLYSQGSLARGSASSAGARHWFGTENFCADWSLWIPNGRAIKACHAGQAWDGAVHTRRIEEARARLEALGRPEKLLSPGDYRAYICPEALAEILPFFSWRGLSEQSLQEGQSAWLALREGRKTLSPAFSLCQDFSLGVEPRFNESGDLAPESLDLIREGKLVSSLVSAKSAVQYGLDSNAAPEGEYLRSPSVGAGNLPEAEALKALDRGVYVSNFHYLNWSDVETARVTGMTRFSCFWVEGGKIVAPIKDMRFDESLYELLGGRLEALTRERTLVAETGSYGVRALGGALLPGILVSGLTFTL